MLTVKPHMKNGANTYISQKGNLTYRYVVEGTKEELEQYANAQGANFRKDPDTGEALFFTTRPMKTGSQLVLTSKGAVAAIDNDKAADKQEAVDTEVAVREQLERNKARKAALAEKATT